MPSTAKALSPPMGWRLLAAESALRPGRDQGRRAVGQRAGDGHDDEQRSADQAKDTSPAPVQLADAESKRIVDRVKRHAWIQRPCTPPQQAEDEAEEAQRDQVARGRGARV